MSGWRLVYSKQAQEDAKKLVRSGLKPKAQALLDVIADDPFATPPRYEKLVGDLAGCYSRRINIQHRLVYEVLPEQHVVHVLRMWTHYEQGLSLPICRVAGGALMSRASLSFRQALSMANRVFTVAWCGS